MQFSVSSSSSRWCCMDAPRLIVTPDPENDRFLIRETPTGDSLWPEIARDVLIWVSIVGAVLSCL